MLSEKLTCADEAEMWFVSFTHNGSTWFVNDAERLIVGDALMAAALTATEVLDIKTRLAARGVIHVTETRCDTEAWMPGKER